MNRLTPAIACITISVCACTSPLKVCNNFEELPDPARDSSVWKTTDNGLLASFGSIDERYPKSVEPAVVIRRSLDVTGWRGERLSAQLLLWSADGADQAECKVSEFRSDDAVLPAGIARARFVRYVMTDIFGPGCGYRKPENFPASLSPDMLDDIDCMDIEPKTVRPVWITVDIPADAAPGRYTAAVTVGARKQKTQTLELNLTVQNRLLPPASEWNYWLDLWQHPSAVARVHGLEPWSDAHFDKMRPLMKMLADAGQKVITATLNKDPWNVQTLDPYEDMILWTKSADGWSYDYSIFDRWVEFMQGVGIGSRINCYSMIPWNNELHYTDAATGGIITVKADPGTKEFEDMWAPFLSDFIEHLKEKGWLEITSIAMDERSPQTMKAVLGFLKDRAPCLGVSLADNHKSYKEYPYLDEIVVSFGDAVDRADLACRKEQGLRTTYYVCCSHEFPNVFSFSPPVEAVYSAWYSRAAGFDGYLRWAYNSWVENPLTDSRFRTWPAGDTYIVYPDARSSIRFERLREGIQDVEKIRILTEEFSAAGSTDKMVRLGQVLAAFDTVDIPENPEETVNRAKSILNSLSD